MIFPDLAIQLEIDVEKFEFRFIFLRLFRCFVKRNIEAWYTYKQFSHLLFWKFVKNRDNLYARNYNFSRDNNENNNNSSPKKINKLQSLKAMTML